MKGRTPISNESVSGEVIGELINLSGRQRMLSQRIVLHVLLASRGDGAALNVVKTCLATFAATHTDLVSGNARLPGVFSDALKQLYFGTVCADDAIRQFIARTANAIASLESGVAASDEQVDALVMQATPLLELLQQITLAYQNEMHGIETAAKKRQAEIAEQLGRISMQANIVALNARIAAARAGHFGREFAVITTVLADIIKEMDQLIHSVVDTRDSRDTRQAPGAPAQRSTIPQSRHANAGRAFQ